LLRAAGFFAWIATGVPGTLAGLKGKASIAELLAWLVCYLGFAVAFWLSTRPMLDGVPGRGRVLGLLVQSACALALVRITSSGYEGVLLTVVAGQAALILRQPIPLAWIGGQSALLLVLLLRSGYPPSSAGLNTLAYAAFQAFALGAAYLARNEAEARRELGRLNTELVSAQYQLEQNAGMAERLRIARDLHDSVGHHLAALNLQLEVASHLPPEKALEQVQRAQEVAKQLMADVRSAVSSLRSEAVPDLRAALMRFAQTIDRPKILLEIPEHLHVQEPLRAQALLRCVQEIITNAVRHAQASTLYIQVHQEAHGVEIRARDDERGSAAMQLGFGLKGMQERMEQVGGTVAVHSETGRGFQIRAWMPLEASR